MSKTVKAPQQNSELAFVPCNSAAAAFLYTLRPWEWSKNLFVFTGLIFTSRLGEPSAVFHAILAFVAFCGLASLVYVLNDFLDRKSDLQHPRKKHRPVASGQLSLSAALAGSAFIAVAVCAVTYSLGSAFAVWAVAYIVLNLGYSAGLKHVIFLDILCIATGFLIRVIAGCAAVDVPASGYAVSCTFSLALLLGTGKRLSELLSQGKGAVLHRAVFNHYTPRLLNVILVVSVLATVVSYILFANSGKHPRSMIATVIPVCYGILRYLQLLHSGRNADEPARLVLKDIKLFLTCAVWGLCCIWIVVRGG